MCCAFDQGHVARFFYNLGPRKNTPVQLVARALRGFPDCSITSWRGRRVCLAPHGRLYTRRFFKQIE